MGFLSPCMYTGFFRTLAANFGILFLGSIQHIVNMRGKGFVYHDHNLIPEKWRKIFNG